jgi:tetratricopeptide (TPR) repeat protein
LIEQTNAMLSRASALRAEGKGPEALALYRRIVQQDPASGLALYSLAAALGDDGAFQEAVEITDRALAVGFDRAETWLVRARALAGLGCFEAATASFEAVLARKPAMLVARYELSQLIWMFTADIDAALAPFEAGLRSTPDEPGLLFARAKALEYMGEIERASDAMGRLAAQRPDALRKRSLTPGARLRSARTNPMRLRPMLRRAWRPETMPPPPSARSGSIRSGRWIRTP